MRKHLTFISLIFCSCALSAAEPHVLEKVLMRAWERNPEIRASRQAWQAKEARIKSVGAWPNPSLSYMLEKLPSGMEGVEPMSMRTYAVEQEIPFPGKLSAESRMQRHEARIADAAYHDKVFEILKDVRLRYYELHMTDRRIALANESVAILQSSMRSAQNRLANAPRGRSAGRREAMEGSSGGMGAAPAGGGNSAADVFMVQTELRKMENMLYSEKQRRILMEIELNTLLDQPTDTPWGEIQPPALADVPVSLQDLQKLARTNSPIYQSAGHERNHSQAMVARSRLAFAPDFGVMYGLKTADAGPDGSQFGASVSIPLWLRRPLGEHRSAKEHREEAEASAVSMQNMVTKMVHIEYVETQTHLTLARSYLNAILPPAKSNLEISRQRYASGQTDFLRLLEAFRSWIDAHSQFEGELYQYAQHWSELGRWAGLDVAQAHQALEHLNMGIGGENGGH